MKTKLFVAAIALLFSFPALAQTACTEIGCVNGLVLHLPPQMQWLPGKYIFTVTTEEGSMTCKGVLPFASCEQEMECSDERLMIAQSGCAMPQDTHSFGPMIQIEGSPASAQLTVARDGQTVIDQSFTPEYTVSRPNGPQCEPECHSANVDIKLLAEQIPVLPPPPEPAQ